MIERWRQEFDVYMPDFTFWHRESERRLCKAKNHPEATRAAIREMHHQVGGLRFGPDGLARWALLVRHRVMPGQTDSRWERSRGSWRLRPASGPTRLRTAGAQRIGVLHLRGGHR